MVDSIDPLILRCFSISLSHTGIVRQLVMMAQPTTHLQLWPQHDYMRTMSLAGIHVHGTSSLTIPIPSSLRTMPPGSASMFHHHRPPTEILWSSTTILLKSTAMLHHRRHGGRQTSCHLGLGFPSVRMICKFNVARFWIKFTKFLGTCMRIHSEEKTRRPWGRWWSSTTTYWSLYDRQDREHVPAHRLEATTLDCTIATGIYITLWLIYYTFNTLPATMY